jgi:hypothetical protein
MTLDQLKNEFGIGKYDYWNEQTNAEWSNALSTLKDNDSIQAFLKEDVSKSVIEHLMANPDQISKYGLPNISAGGYLNDLISSNSTYKNFIENTVNNNEAQAAANLTQNIDDTTTYNLQLEDTQLFDDKVKTDIANSLTSNSSDIYDVMFNAVSGSNSQLELAIANQATANNTALSAYADAMNASSESMNNMLNNANDRYESQSQQILGSFNQATANAIGQYTASSNNYLSNYQSQVTSAIDGYDAKVGAIIDKFQNTSNDFIGRYDQAVTKATEDAGKADDDMVSRLTGQYTAGISQAYAEAQDELNASLAQRGLAGSGVQADSLTRLAGSEATDKASAMSKAYTDAIVASDQRRQAEVTNMYNLANTGINQASQQAQLGMSGAMASMQSQISGASNVVQGGLQGAGLASGMAAQGAGQAFSGASQAAATGLASITQSATQYAQAQQVAGQNLLASQLASNQQTSNLAFQQASLGLQGSQSLADLYKSEQDFQLEGMGLAANVYQSSVLAGLQQQEINNTAEANKTDWGDVATGAAIKSGIEWIFS